MPELDPEVEEQATTQLRATPHATKPTMRNDIVTTPFVDDIGGSCRLRVFRGATGANAWELSTVPLLPSSWPVCLAGVRSSTVRAKKLVHLGDGLFQSLARAGAQPPLKVVAGFERRAHHHSRAAVALDQADADVRDR